MKRIRKKNKIESQSSHRYGWKDYMGQHTNIYSDSDTIDLNKSSKQYQPEPVPNLGYNPSNSKGKLYIDDNGWFLGHLNVNKRYDSTRIVDNYTQMLKDEPVRFR